MAAMLSGRRIAILIAIVVVGLSASIYTSYLRDIHRAQERISIGSRIAETRCGPIEYGVGGDGPPVLFVHGAGGGFDQGLDFGRTLVASGFRVIAMSRFGYLRTPLPADASAAAQADAHACLLDALGIPYAAVIGGSAGAPSSLQLALRHPDRVSRLVLVVPALYVPRAGGEPSLQTPARTEFLFETALKSDFLFWAAIRLVRRTMLHAILATPPEIVDEASAEERARVEGNTSGYLASESATARVAQRRRSHVQSRTLRARTNYDAGARAQRGGRPLWDFRRRALHGRPHPGRAFRRIHERRTLVGRASARAHVRDSGLSQMKARLRSPQSFVVRNRNALPTTDTDDKLIARLAMIGDSSQPSAGYNTPAARGTPSAL